MIVAMRAFQASGKMINTGDEEILRNYNQPKEIRR